VLIRCTAKVLALLGTHRSSLPELEPAGDDWYVNLLWLDRRKCLLATQARTTFSVLVADVRKAELRSLGPLLADAIAEALEAERLPHDILGDLDGSSAQLAPTASRRTLGIMNDLALQIGYRVRAHGGLAGIDTVALNQELQRSLHNFGGHYATPLELTTGLGRRQQAEP
jgi:hypothetical protein